MGRHMPEQEWAIHTTLSVHSLLKIIMSGSKENQIDLSNFSELSQGLELVEEITFTQSTFLGHYFVLARRQERLFGSLVAGSHVSS